METVLIDQEGSHSEEMTILEDVNGDGATRKKLQFDLDKNSIHEKSLESQDEADLLRHPILKKQLCIPTSDLHLSDGTSTIDYVLVWRDDDTSDMRHLHERRRDIFHRNLEKEGLVLEEDGVSDVPLRFMKIYAPFEVCTRYAEILKLRMPMKQGPDADFLKRKIVFHFPGLPVFEFSAPALLVDMTDFFYNLFNFVRNDPKIFPPLDRHFNAVYSRDKNYLFDVTDTFFTPRIRGGIVDFILRRKKYIDEAEGDDFAFGIDKLINEGTYCAAYPIHEGDVEGPPNTRQTLFRYWARIRNLYKYQPLDHIKEYFGVKIGLYFAWLGFYTFMLIPPAIVGILCFIYAVSTIHLHQPSNDICNKNTNVIMCPLCDQFCDFWKLDEFCFHAKFTYLVDNPATVFFTVFMCFWATTFLELWKRYSSEITHRWDLTGFDTLEEHPRPEYLARLKHIKKKTVNIITKTLEPRPPFWKMRFPGVMISVSSVVLLVILALAAVMGVILYRMSVLAALSIHGDDVLTSYALIFTSATAAFINLFCIVIFNQIYYQVAVKLTELELRRTQTEFDDSLTLKIYLLQFINYYASIFYIAFVKGKNVGYPGEYNRIFNFRQEECSPGGCLLELSVQLCIIMIGKQFINSLMEMIMPLLWRWYGLLTVKSNNKVDASRDWPRWAKDFKLCVFDSRGLFPEYLEMVLQYGFVTIFVSSFPLAPLFAFLNNVFEIRLDAKKMLTHYRRPVSQRVKNIGVWFRILDSVGKLAVVTNAFIIAFTSNFIPELVYRLAVSENKSLDGFLDTSLSSFNVSDFPPQYGRPHTDVEICRYSDYREAPGTDNEYKYSAIYWHILAARLAFVVVFQNVVVVMMIFIKWLIPDLPHRLQEQIRREAYVINELIVEQELHKARGDVQESQPPTSPYRRQKSEPIRRLNSSPPGQGSPV